MLKIYAPLFATVVGLYACATKTTSPEAAKIADTQVAPTHTDNKKEIPVNQESVEAGTTVKVQGQQVALYPGKLKKGDHLAKIIEKTLQAPQVEKWSGSVVVIDVVPSVDTPVCEEQTHRLGETTMLDPTIKRVTISRDLPTAQNRFATAAKLTNIIYLSDFKSGEFGKKTGLLMKDRELLARAVIVLDQTGRVAYYQIVPEVSQLPNMEAAFKAANELVKKPEPTKTSKSDSTGSQGLNKATRSTK